MSEQQKDEKKVAGKITQEALDEFRSRIGTRLRVRDHYNELASADSVRHFADGIGDPNPLFRDPEYAAKTVYGKITAPPSWLYSVNPTYVHQGLRGVHAFHAGNDWTFLKPVYAGDLITPEITFSDFVKKESEFAGSMIIEYQTAKYLNQNNEVVAQAKSWLVRAERTAAKKKGKYHKITLPHPWDEEELNRIEDEIAEQPIRGSVPRYWEDVKVGDTLPAVSKGPFGLTDIIAFMMGCGAGQIYAHDVALLNYRKRPALAFRDTNTKALEPYGGVHWNVEAAKAAGLPFPYAIGIQMQAWLIQLFTHWMGDEGWLKRNYAEYRKFVYFSDVIRMDGKVTKKYIDDDGDYCVEIESRGVNQRGEDVIPGCSTVVLPSREIGFSPTAKFSAKR